MATKIRTDEVVTQGDEYLRAKAGELDKDTDAPATGGSAQIALQRDKAGIAPNAPGGGAAKD